MDRKIFKKEIALQLTKLRIGRKRMIDKERVGKILIRDLKNFGKFDIFNLIGIKIEDKILKKLQKYQRGNYKYRFTVEGLLSSSGIKNKTNLIFTTCKSFSDASEAITNGKRYRALSVINLNQMENWEIKKDSN